MKIYDKKIRILKIVLIICSIALLLSNWMIFTDEFDNVLDDYLDFYGLENLAVIYSDSATNYVNTLSALEEIEDEQLSAKELFIISINVKPFLSIGDSIFEKEVSYNDLICLSGWTFFPLFIVFIFVGVVALIRLVFTGQTFFDRAYFYISVLLISVLLFWSAWFAAVYDMFTIRPTIWSLLFVLSTIPTEPLSGFVSKCVSLCKNIIGIVSNKKIKADEKGLDVNGWKCKTCGTYNNGAAAFCVNCGKKKTQIIICATCGYKKWDDEPCKNCQQIVKQKRHRFCTQCGCQLEKESVYCQFCGIKVG